MDTNETPTDSGKLDARLQRIVELKVEGKSLREITEVIRAEGFGHVNLTSIWRSLEGERVQVFIAELARTGLEAIHQLDDKPFLKVKGIMEFLKWFAPPTLRIDKRSIEVKVDPAKLLLLKEYDELFHVGDKAKPDKTVVEPAIDT